jgi:O-antigen/teichoic acid export membrane protein
MVNFVNPRVSSIFKSNKVFQLLYNTISFGVGDLLQKFLAFFLLPIYTNHLEPKDYGLLGLLGILTLVGGVVTTCGLTNGIGRYIYYTDEENVSRDEVVWSPLLFVIGVTAVVVAVLVYFSTNLSEFLFETVGHEYLIVLTLANIFVSNISGIGRSILIYEERVWTVNVINITGVVVGASAGIVLVAFFERGVQGAVEAGLITSVFMGVLTSFTSLRRYVPRFHYEILKKQLRFSFPLATATLIVYIIDSSDRYVLKMFLPLSEVGLYNVGYQIGMVVLIFVGGFCTAWPPYYHRNNQKGEGQRICKQVLHIYLLVVPLLAVIISQLSPLVINLLTPESYHEAFTVVPFVTIAYMLTGIYPIFLMGVLMKNKTIWKLWLEFFAMILNVVLNIVLIPLVGREAAAITTLVSYSVMVVGSCFMMKRINPIPDLSMSKPLTVIMMAGIISLIVLIPGYQSIYIWAFPSSLLVFVVALYFLYRRSLNQLLMTFHH